MRMYGYSVCITITNKHEEECLDMKKQLHTGAFDVLLSSFVQFMMRITP